MTLSEVQIPKAFHQHGEGEKKMIYTGNRMVSGTINNKFDEW